MSGDVLCNFHVSKMYKSVHPAKLVVAYIRQDLTSSEMGLYATYITREGFILMSILYVTFKRNITVFVTQSVRIYLIYSVKMNISILRA